MANPLPPHNEGVSKKHHSEPGILLSTAKGNRVELTASRLEAWFAQVELSLRNSKHKSSPTNTETSTPELATQLLSRYGLQTSQDVIKFLKSPAGEATVAMIGEELAEIAAVQERTRHELMEQHLLHKRILAFLFLGLLYRREAHAHRLNENTQEMNEKRVHSAEKATPQNTGEKTLSALERENMERSLAAYSEATNALTKTLDNKLEQSEALEAQLDEVERDITLTDEKYEAYNTSVDEIYHLAPATETIEEKIHDLAKLIDNDADIVSSLLDAGDEDAARELIRVSTARNIQVAVLRDMLSVVNGSKALFTLNGSTTTNFNEADFILPRDKKIVLKNDKYYLLKENDDFATLSSEERDAGERAYLRLRPEIMGVKQLVQHNQKLERGEHIERQSRLAARSELMQQEIALLARQLTQIQAARAEIEAALKPAAPGVRMTPLPMPTVTATNRHVNDSVAQSYRHILQLMRNAAPTPRAIDWLKTGIANTGDPKLQAQINQLTPGTPIPPVIMSQLLARKDLGRLWMNPNTPDAVKMNFTPPMTPRPEPEPSMAPTPFSTRPKPY